jgi:hypothetical protein
MVLALTYVRRYPRALSTSAPCFAQNTYDFTERDRTAIRRFVTVPWAESRLAFCSCFQLPLGLAWSAQP